MRKLRGAADPTAEDVRARIRRDIERLNPRARWRYRAALRRLMRQAEQARVRRHLPPRLHMAINEILAAAVAFGAFASVVVFGGSLVLATLAAGGGAMLALLLASPAGRAGIDDALDVVDLPPDGDPAATAFALHLGAMAQSRHAYYVGDPERDARDAERVV